MTDHTHDTAPPKRPRKATRPAQPTPFASPGVSLPTGASSVLRLQRLVGNAATQRLLGGGTTRIQRCNGNPNCTCPKCSARRAAAAQAVADPDEIVQRAPTATATAPALTAPEIAGDARLQKAAGGDKASYIRKWQKNDSVKTIQEALLSLNYQLPKHGADGHYGSETQTAIMNFQGENHLNPDGVVGPKTLKKLNSALLSPKPPTPGSPKLTPGDVEQPQGVFDDGGTQRNNIFFAKGSAALTDDANATDKLKLIAADALPVFPHHTVTGIRSEDEPDAVATQRMNAVADQLKKDLQADPDNILFDVTPVAKPEVGDGKIDYPKMRMVTISETGGTSPVPECKVIDPPDPDGLKKSFELAGQRLDAVMAKLVDPATAPLVDKYFGTSDANRAEVTAIIGRNLVKLKTQLLGHLAKQSEDGKPGHHCGTECYEICASATAYVSGGHGPSARMVLCPNFFTNYDISQRAMILIHEGSHATADWETTVSKDAHSTDHAYGNMRLNTQLEPEHALANADSYRVFIQEALGGSITFDMDVGKNIYEDESTVDPQVKADADKAIAYVEAAITTSSTSVNGAYSGIEEAQDAGGWNAYTGRRAQYTLMARRFQLTMPPAAPTNEDQVMVAGIFHQVQAMVAAIRKTDITIKVDATAAASSWSFDKGTKLTIGADFIAAGDDRARMELLLLAYTSSFPGISPDHAEQYAGMMGDMRRNRNLAEAPTG